VSIGDYVKEGQDMVNLESLDPLKVDFRVPEISLSQVRTADAADLSRRLPDKGVRRAACMRSTRSSMRTGARS
jgi:membrane fusion protein (multidrug efflux system)